MHHATRAGPRRIPAGVTTVPPAVRIGRDPRAFHRGCPGYAADPPGRRARARGRARARRAVGEGRVEPARAAVVQDPRRVVGDLPAARRPARPRAGVADARRAARRARHRSARSRSSPRPTATTAGRSRAWPACSATRRRILVPAGTAAARIDRRSSREGATGRRWSTAPTTTRSRRRPRSRPTTCSSCRTRRGTATPRCPRDGHRGLRDDLRRGRRAARGRAARCRRRADGRGRAHRRRRRALRGVARPWSWSSR